MNSLGRWLTRQALRRFARLDPPATALHDLPLVEVAAHGPAPSDTLAVFLSGDGGWTVITRAISHGLALGGVPTIGFNSLKYFWHARTPEETGADIGRVLSHYLPAWGKERALLIGYSRGAGALPFVFNRLQESLRARVRLMTLLAPGQVEEFEVRLRDFFEDSLERLHHWGVVGRHFDLPEALKAGPVRGARPILPELERLRGLPLLCIHGAREARSLAHILPPGLARVVRRPGGHHFDRDYAAIARSILDAMAEHP